MLKLLGNNITKNSYIFKKIIDSRLKAKVEITLAELQN